MKKIKLDKIKNSKFLKAIKEHAPDILDAVGTVFPPADKLGEILEGVQEDKKEAIRLAHSQDLESFALEVQDRESARILFSSDSLTQKILAGLFTCAYFGISFVLIRHFFINGEDLTDYELGFISTLFGAMSSKVNTIIDFFFGGSVK